MNYDYLKSISDSTHITKTNRLKGQVEVLKKELIDSFIGNKLGLAKEILWEEITEEIKEIWPSIKIIFNQKDLLEKAQEAVESINRQLDDMPKTASNIIKFLNSKDDYELEELRISGKTATILEVKKIITKINLNL